MAFKAFVAIAIIAFSGISEARNVCGPFEVFKECGSPCDEKCVTDGPMICPAMCASGCFCEEGMVRSPMGMCVPKKNCNLLRSEIVEESKCGLNAIYNDCGSACEKKCGRSDNLMCTKQCVPGCYCQPGYIKNENGQCITQGYCNALLNAKKDVSFVVEKEECGENEEFTACGSSCGPTCQNPFGPWACPDNCIRGCVCKDGYFRNNKLQCVQYFNC